VLAKPYRVAGTLADNHRRIAQKNAVFEIFFRKFGTLDSRPNGYPVNCKTAFFLLKTGFLGPAGLWAAPEY